MDETYKPALRQQLRERLATLSAEEKHAKGVAACALVTGSAEFQAARVVMIYLSTHDEVDTAPIALRAWQSGKAVVAPKVSLAQRRMLPVEISSLKDGMTTSRLGVREPMIGKPIPVEFIDLVIVPGLGFTADGHRIGRGMGFYDRFLGQADFIGLSCGLAFEEQLVERLPMLDHDIPLGMLATDRGLRRFAANRIGVSY